jgi:hypothetical protein
MDEVIIYINKKYFRPITYAFTDTITCTKRSAGSEAFAFGSVRKNGSTYQYTLFLMNFVD